MPFVTNSRSPSSPRPRDRGALDHRSADTLSLFLPNPTWEFPLQNTYPPRGFQWFTARYKDPAAVFLEQVSQAAAGVLAAIDAIASQRPVSQRIVLGYSQGAHLAWWLATTGRVDHVIAVSGALPPGVPRGAGSTSRRCSSLGTP